MHVTDTSANGVRVKSGFVPPLPSVRSFKRPYMMRAGDVYCFFNANDLRMVARKRVYAPCHDSVSKLVLEKIESFAF